MSGDLDLRPFQLKIGTPLTHTLANVHTNFDFSTFFCSPVTQARTGQMDRRTGKTRNVDCRKTAEKYGESKSMSKMCQKLK